MTNQKLDIPFLKSRGFECGQACVAMIIKYFKPNFKPNFNKFNKIIHHKKGKYSFPLQLAILLDHYGFKTKCLSSEGYKTTEEDPKMFARWYGKDVEHEIKFINTKSFDWMVLYGRKRKLIQKRKTSFDEIVNLFIKGKIVCFPIDWATLAKKGGPYQGHFVLLSGIENGNILLHDPDVGAFIKYEKEKVENAYSHPAITDDLVVVYGEK